MPRSQHPVATPAVASYGAHRHAGRRDDAPSSGTPGAPIATAPGRQRVWTWKPLPDTAAQLDQA